MDRRKFIELFEDGEKKPSEKISIPRNWRPSAATIEEISSPLKTNQENDDQILEQIDKDIDRKAIESECKSITEDKERQRRSALGSKFQGNIGEGITLRTATDRLGFTPDSRFDQSAHGFDAVYHDESGNIVIIESKLDKRGIRSLRENQMQPDWVESNAKKMQTPGDERFTSGNAEIGHEIQDIGAENIRRIVIITDPQSLEIKAFEGQKDRNWKQIGSWNALDLEQPYLE